MSRARYKPSEVQPSGAGLQLGLNRKLTWVLEAECRWLPRGWRSISSSELEMAQSEQYVSPCFNESELYVVESIRVSIWAIVVESKHRTQ